jgi:Ca-activated chloride channel family protein
MSRSRRPLWLYPIFQYPLIFLGIFLVLAALFWLLGLGRPNVAVAIALDLSGSTYGNQVELSNQPGTVLNEEVKAVNTYLEYNNKNLKKPNEIAVFGFGGEVLPLTKSFQTESGKIKAQLKQSLENPNLIQEIDPGATNINRAISEGVKALLQTSNSCRELLLVTDGIADVSPQVIAEATLNKVKVNVVLIGQEAPALREATLATKGIYLSGEAENLGALFTEKLFARFNSNLKWIVLWLGAAWVAFMWLLTLPLDRWIFQGIMKYHWSLAGRLALGNALFWSVVTPIILWQMWKLLGLPFFSSC